MEISPSEASDYPRIYGDSILDLFNLKVAQTHRRSSCRERRPTSRTGSTSSSSPERSWAASTASKPSSARPASPGCTRYGATHRQATDLTSKLEVCLKIIDGNKTFFDQSIEEIKMMRLISRNFSLDEKFLLKMHDYFYCREHLVIVTELLSFNLYDYQMSLREKNQQNYFSKARIRLISQQVLTALEALHSLNVIHCDLKPENILFQSVKDCRVKLIDFGSCSFLHDEPAFYMQTRPYRAPELLLGCQYDEKIDIWSLGCVLAELYLGTVLFECRSVPGILAKMMAIFGPFPEWMMKTGKLVKKFFTRDLLPFHETSDPKDEYANDSRSKKQAAPRLEILVPKKIDILQYFGKEDDLFLDFLFKLVEIDPIKR